MPDNIIIAAGGTGGHIIPALTVAENLRNLGYNINWIGTKNGLESSLVPKNNFAINYIDIGGVRGKSKLVKLLAPFKILKALVQSLRLIYKLKPRAVLVFGGYVAGPVGLAAFLLRKKLIIHEQNSIAGNTNKILANFADVVLSAYPDAFAKKVKIKLVGNPVRSIISAIAAPEIRFANRDGAIRILILGGSKGAHFLNQQIPLLLKEIAKQINLEVYHQCGAGNYQVTAQLYQDFAGKITVCEFIDNMQEIYAWADFAICRSGALTVAELTCVGLGALLIPYPHAVDDHQTKNGQYLVDRSAAIMVQQRDFVLAEVAIKLVDLFKHRENLIKMAQNAYSLALKDSVDLICKCVDDYKAYEETAYLMRSSKNATRLNQSIKELETGKQQGARPRESHSCPSSRPSERK